VESCENSGQEPKYHFADAGKMIETDELLQNQTVANFATVQKEGCKEVRREM